MDAQHLNQWIKDQEDRLLRLDEALARQDQLIHALEARASRAESAIVEMVDSSSLERGIWSGTALDIVREQVEVEVLEVMESHAAELEALSLSFDRFDIEKEPDSMIRGLVHIRQDTAIDEDDHIRKCLALRRRIDDEIKARSLMWIDATF